MAVVARQKQLRKQLRGKKFPLVKKKRRYLGNSIIRSKAEQSLNLKKKTTKNKINKMLTRE